MKKQMEIKNVNKNTFLLFFLMTTSLALSQSTKYILFDKTKDSIINVDKIKYYKIDKNLFNIDRYNAIDTIVDKKIRSIKFTSVNNLWRSGKQIHDSIIKEGIKIKKLKVIETYNEIFDYIYVVEKVKNCKYKRTRVWWIDY
ncbi:hypothetical protein [Polaribacter sp. R77954]|uniref:hypothetical protein n=1 Tax=Polaribacter sp. R77954 TaxID=3093870 RepID=UPI0037CB09E7